MEPGFTLDRATGRVTLVIGGTAYTLPAPDFGQFRDYMTLNLKRLEQEMELLAVWDEEPAEPETEGSETVSVEAKATQTILDNIKRETERQNGLILIRFDFWRQAFAIFGVTLPADNDRIEPWIGNAELCNQVVHHWLDFPFPPPGDKGTVS